MRNDIYNLIPKTDMLAWYRHDPATSANGNIVDAAGIRGPLAQATNPPILTQSLWKGRPGWVFDGTKNPLVSAGNATAKHIFIIAALEENSFTVNRGLLSGTTSGDWLTTNNSGSTFLTPHTDYDYRKADVVFADSDWQAPTGLKPLLIEVTHPAGVLTDGIQVGQQMADTARKFKGYFFELGMYSTVQADEARRLWAEYAALVFNIYQKVSAGHNVFPFQPDWAVPMAADKLVLRSTSINGTERARAKSLARTGYQTGYSARWAEEWDAAFDFWNITYPGSPFIYRNYGFSPTRDVLMRFSGGIDAQHNDYHDIDYKWEAVSEDENDVNALPDSLFFEDDLLIFSEEV